MIFNILPWSLLDWISLVLISSNEIQLLSNELNAASGKLSSMAELAEQALDRAKKVYEEALGLYAEVNTTMLPDIKIGNLKQEASEVNKTVSYISDILSKNKDS